MLGHSATPGTRSIARDLLLAALLALGTMTAQAGFTSTDDAGNRVVLPGVAARIVSLAPHITELLYAASAGDRIVGAVDFSNHPSAAQGLPRIGSHASFDFERIVTLKPDLAIAWGGGNPPGQLERLRQLGIPVFVNSPQKLADIPATLRQFGRLAGTLPLAEQAAQAFENRQADLAARHGGQRPVTVFYEIWNQPLMTVGGSHIISDVLALCGGRNVFATLTQPAATIGIEAVLRANPEVILASGMDTARPEWLDDWRRWPQLAAVRKDNLAFVPPDLLQRHTPRLLDGATQVCAALERARLKDQAGR